MTISFHVNFSVYRKKGRKMLTRMIKINKTEIFSLKNVLIVWFHEFQPTGVLADRSKNAKCIRIKNY